MTTAQSIIPNRIDWNLSGKTIILTGGSSGLGKATAMELAKMGMRRLILACKNVHAGEAAAREIRERAGGLAPDVVAVRQLDLSSLESIRRFAHDIIAHEPDLHILINNAGYYAGSTPDRKITKDGFELHFAVNYIGQYLLTLLLLGLLKRSAPSRIVNVTTGTFWLRLAGQRGFRVDDPNFDKHPGDFTPTQAYSLSKMATILFTRVLHRHLHPVLKDDFSVDPKDLEIAAALPCSLSLDPTQVFDPSVCLPRNSISSPILSRTLTDNRYNDLLSEDTKSSASQPASTTPNQKTSSSSTTPEEVPPLSPLPIINNKNNNKASDIIINNNRRKSSAVPLSPAPSSDLRRPSSAVPISSAATAADRRQSAAVVGTDKRKSSMASSTGGGGEAASKQVSIKPRVSIISIDSTSENKQPVNNTEITIETNGIPLEQLNIVKKPGKRPEIPVVSVFAVSPGSFIRTDLYKHLSPSKRRLMVPFFKTPEAGAVMIVYCASQEGIEKLSGKYFVKCSPVEPPAKVADEAAAKKLWQMSAKLVDDATNKMIVSMNKHHKPR